MSDYRAEKLIAQLSIEIHHGLRKNSGGSRDGIAVWRLA
jgi:hypothetical protein